MKRAFQIAAFVLIALTIAFFIAAIILLRETQLGVRRLSNELDGLERPTQNALAQIAAASKTLAQVGAQERNAFAEQQRYYVKLGQSTDALLASANKTIEEVNNDLLPKIAADLDSANVAIKRDSDSFARTSSAAEDTIEAAREPLIAITSDAEALRPAINNLAQITAHGAEISSNLEATTGDVKEYVHRLTRPVKGTFEAIKSFLNFVWTVRGATGL